MVFEVIAPGGLEFFDIYWVWTAAEGEPEDAPNATVVGV